MGIGWVQWIGYVEFIGDGELPPIPHDQEFLTWTDANGKPMHLAWDSANGAETLISWSE